MSAAGNTKIPIPIKGISCQDLLLERDIVHSGYLRRRHTVNKVLNSFTNSSMIPKWPNCYVVLRDGCIYIYKDERSKTAMKACSLYGFLQLHECSDSEVPSNVSWVFKLASELDLNSPFFYFSAPTQADMKRWMNCIQEQMNYANNYRSTGKAASSAPLPTSAVSSKPAAATGGPFSPGAGPPVAARNRPILTVNPKQALVPPTLQQRDDLVYEAGSDSSNDYDELSENDEDEKKSDKASNVLRNKLSPLKIGDEPAAPDRPSETADDHKMSDYLDPKSPPLVKPKPGVAPKKRLPEVKQKSFEKSTGVVKPQRPNSEGGGYYVVEREASDADEESVDYTSTEEYPTFMPTIQEDTGLEPLVQKAFWHGAAQKGEKLMRSVKQDGVYMFRASTAEPGKETMLVTTGAEVLKYHMLVTEDGRYSLVKSGPFFETKTSLLLFYKDNHLPQQRSAKLTKLINPYTAFGHSNR